MVTTSCVLQLRPGASPQSRGYVYTGPQEVSSLVTDLPGTRVTPAYRNIKYKKFYVYSDDTHTHKNSPLHHPSITLTLPFPLLLFCAQSKSGEVGNMWGYPVL